MGVGLRPDAKSAGRATDPLPATRLSSTLQLIAYKSLYFGRLLDFKGCR